MHHHRASLSYPPPPQASAPESSRYRQHSPPQQSNLPYAPQPQRQSLTGQSAWSQPMMQHGSAYEHRSSYYPEPANPTFAFERSHDAYYHSQSAYAGPPHHGYENGYPGDIRFHQHVGMDQNAFNRRRRGNLPKEATNMLKDWFVAHRSSPYPTEDEKIDLCNRTGLSLNQVRLNFHLRLVHRVSLLQHITPSHFKVSMILLACVIYLAVYLSTCISLLYPTVPCHESTLHVASL